VKFPICKKLYKKLSWRVKIIHIKKGWEEAKYLGVDWVYYNKRKNYRNKYNKMEYK
jgi:hypothetical protein